MDKNKQIVGVHCINIYFLGVGRVFTLRPLEVGARYAGLTLQPEI